MSTSRYLIAAYVGAGVLYVGYLLWLFRQERALWRKTRGPAR
ncbi:MAG TPA: hypothetical protein VK962_00075 [Actinomycetota bacterium]|nr:hypothetical protein [Actinomycetota bacterium]